jgi:LuxR family maltose regulon positive regulatory protein
MQAGLSREQLAERAGLSPQAIGAIEQGMRRRPYPHTLAALAEALDLGPDDRAALLQAAAPAQLTLNGAPPTPRLPVLAAALIGREAELAALSELLQPGPAQARLVTLVGPGGVGKTSLGLAVAATLAPQFEAGAAFVDLAQVSESRLVPATIARALDVHESAGRSAHDLLLSELREAQVLLVLDNFEHLTEAAPLLVELVEACPRLAVLATSRAVLRLSAERRFAVEPLATPTQGRQSDVQAIVESPAVRLFVERARVVSPDFAVTPENAATVAMLCRRLEGLPLAIELAAARIGFFTPEALAGRLERRLPMLTGGPRDRPSRHQTLRAALAWSHDLLGPSEQVLFRRLSVFAGGCTPDAVDAVCADGELPAEHILEVLQALRDSSLIQVERSQAGTGSTRITMLETIREYAEELFAGRAEVGPIRRRHRDWYLAWLEQALPEPSGPPQLAAYRAIDGELDNLRGARDESRADPDGAEVELRLAASLGRYWSVRAPEREGRAWLSEALRRSPAAPSAARATALTWSGQMERVHGRANLGEARLREAVEVARQQPDVRVLVLALRHLALYGSDLKAAEVLLDEAIRIARASSNQRELALSLTLRAMGLEQAGKLAVAEDAYVEAVAAARGCGDATALAQVSMRLGALLLSRGGRAAANTCLVEAAAISEATGDVLSLAESNAKLAELALDDGNTALAEARIGTSLHAVRGLGSGFEALWPLRAAARTLAAAGYAATAVQLFAAQAAWRTRHLGADTLWTQFAVPPPDEDLDALRDSLGEQVFAGAYTSGGLLTLQEAVDTALQVARDLAPAASQPVTSALPQPDAALTNIGPPPIRRELVLRQRVLERFETALTHTVTLVAAPAGFGKTSAMVVWEAQVRARALIGWVSLTPADNDPARFWRCVLTTLQAKQAGLGARALTRLQARAPVWLVQDELLRDLAGLDHQLALVLDDYHCIQTPAIHATIAELVSRCPPQFHLVIGTRADPPLPLARLRANGQLLEIRADELRFSASEASDLLSSVMHLDLSSEQIAALSVRTEGWAAGLQLAALTLRERADVPSAIANFAGDDRFVIDYFVEEVLARLPPRARVFLERTSILDRLNGPLCDAVVGESGSQALLEELERANVFVTPANEQRTWYRYHQLFAGALRHRLQRDEPELALDLHRRASAWLAASGLLEDAVEHALDARDWDSAAQCIGRLGMSLIRRGEDVTLQRWSARLPVEVCQRHPLLSGQRAAMMMVAGELEALDAFVRGAEPALEAAGQHRALGGVLCLHALLAALRDDPAMALACAERGLSLLPPGGSGFRTTALNAVARSHFLSGDVRAAEGAVADALASADASVILLATWEAGNHAAYLQLLQGKLRRASAGFAEQIQIIGNRPDFSRQVAHIQLAVLAYEWNRLDDMAEHLDRLSAVRQQAGRTRQLHFPVLLSARLARARGEYRVASAALDQCEAGAAAAGNLRIQRVARAERAWLALLQGNLTDASRWAESVDAAELERFAREPEALVLARVRRAQGEGRTVVPLLERLLASAEEVGREISVVGILAQLAVVHAQHGDERRALDALQRALALAEPEGYVRLFIDEGASMSTLLQRALQRQVSAGYVARLLSAADATQGAAREFMTRREREVLRLLALGLSNRAISEQLVTSQATVKTHIHHLIGKLGVSSRAQVVIRAREMGVLEGP